MSLKNYSIRLDEEEYEKLRTFLSDYGDPDLNVGYLFREYVKDLNTLLPDLKKRAGGIRNTLAFWRSIYLQMVRTVSTEELIKGNLIDRIINEGQAKEKG